MIQLLVVEDELSTVFAMHEFFTHAGYRIDCAGGPKEALRLLDRQPYDAVITDLHLTANRRAEGLAVAGYARAKNPTAYIVILTAYASETSEDVVRESGVDLYETKPIELARLAKCIETGVPRGSSGTHGIAAR